MIKTQREEVQIEWIDDIELGGWLSTRIVSRVDVLLFCRMVAMGDALVPPFIQPHLLSTPSRLAT